MGSNPFIGCSLTSRRTLLIPIYRDTQTQPRVAMFAKLMDASNQHSEATNKQTPPQKPRLSPDTCFTHSDYSREMGHPFVYAILMTDLYNVLLATAFSLVFASFFVGVAHRILACRCW